MKGSCCPVGAPHELAFHHLVDSRMCCCVFQDMGMAQTLYVIFRHPSDLQTKKDYTDYRYNEIDGAKLHKGILRSSIDFTVKVSGKLESIDLNHLPKGKAARACGLISENRVRYQTPFAGYANVPPAAIPPRRKVP